MVMRRRFGRRKSGFRQGMGVVLAIAGAAIVLTSLPPWLWLLALGFMLLWSGVALATGTGRR